MMRIQAQTEGMVSRFAEQARRLRDGLVYGRSPKWFLLIPLSVLLTGALVARVRDVQADSFPDRAPFVTRTLRRTGDSNSIGGPAGFPTRQQAIDAAIQDFDNRTDQVSSSLTIHILRYEQIAGVSVSGGRWRATLFRERTQHDFHTGDVTPGHDGVIRASGAQVVNNSATPVVVYTVASPGGQSSVTSFLEG